MKGLQDFREATRYKMNTNKVMISPVFIYFGLNLKIKRKKLLENLDFFGKVSNKMTISLESDARPFLLLID